MIRPVTCLCMLLAAGSGLFLYQSKHRAQVLDQDIARILKAADANRERMRVMRAEYQLLQDPQRMQDLATQHLALVKTDSKQFVSWAVLEKTVPVFTPPPLPPIDVPPETPVAGPVAPIVTPAAPPPVVVAHIEPAAPPRPTPPATASVAARAISTTQTVNAQSGGSALVAAASAARQAMAPALMASAAPLPRSSLGMAHAEPSPMPFSSGRVASPVPQPVMLTTPRRLPYLQPSSPGTDGMSRIGSGNYPPPGGGSALGMARMLSSPSFTPPSNSAGWVTNGNGG